MSRDKLTLVLSLKDNEHIIEASRVVVLAPHATPALLQKKKTNDMPQYKTVQQFTFFQQNEPTIEVSIRTDWKLQDRFKYDCST